MTTLSKYVIELGCDIYHDIIKFDNECEYYLSLFLLRERITPNV